MWTVSACSVFLLKAETWTLSTTSSSASWRSRQVGPFSSFGPKVTPTCLEIDAKILVSHQKSVGDVKHKILSCSSTTGYVGKFRSPIFVGVGGCRKPVQKRSLGEHLSEQTIFIILHVIYVLYGIYGAIIYKIYIYIYVCIYVLISYILFLLFNEF